MKRLQTVQGKVPLPALLYLHLCLASLQFSSLTCRGSLGWTAWRCCPGVAIVNCTPSLDVQHQVALAVLSIPVS